MKKNLSSIILLLIASHCLAQNLVPNPSFEDTVHCPVPPLGTGLIQDAVGWINLGFTPDYYNPCANTLWPPNGVPN